MLQQTPVARVEPVWASWLARWPTPASLAAATPGDALRAWGRLGYPRRAVRLHEAAHLIVERHGGRVPKSYPSLRALPGVGDYTAAAVASFAFGQRHVVLDTNVRRVLARAVGGDALPAPAVTAGERRRAQEMLPGAAGPAARWAVAVMELGALVCTARRPDCGRCPIRGSCAWLRAGQPEYSGRALARQAFEGTDRPARGQLLAVLRSAPSAVPKNRLDAAWADSRQRERALDGLVADGLVEPVGPDLYQLPERRAAAAT